MTLDNFIFNPTYKKRKMASSPNKIENGLAKSVETKPAEVFPQVKCALIVSMGYFITGNIISWSGASLTKLDKDFTMAAKEFSLVASLISYGALVGTLLSGRTMDAIGRRRIMLVIAPLAAAGWAVIGFASNLYLIYLGRVICGISNGFLFTSCSIYTSETCQSTLRGRLGSMPALNMTIGILTGYILGYFFSWRMCAFICIIPAIAFFAGLLFIPESPYWFLLKGDEDSATRSLVRLRGEKYSVDSEIIEMKDKISAVGAKVSYGELLNRRSFLPLLVALFVQTLQQFCGANVIVMYTSTIFTSSGSSIDAQMATIYTGMAQVCGTLLSVFVIDKFGRRILLIVSVILCGSFMATLGGYFLSQNTEASWPSWLPVFIALGFMVSYGLGCRSIPYLISSELFNTSVRSRANSIIVFYNRLLHLLTIQVYPFAVEGFGESTIFLSYGVLCPLCALGTFLFVPETKGKTLEAIQEYFESKAIMKKSDKKAADTGE